VARPIAFLTDLGIDDDAVGMCKGLMLSISPASPIADITHTVPPFNVEEAAHYFADLPEYFPRDTVFCCVVYPETGAGPSIVLRNSYGQLFVAPDNGVLSLVTDVFGPTEAFQIDNPEVMRTPPSPSFYGRDVIVACAAHLAAGVPVEDVGPLRDSVVRLQLAAARLEEHGPVGIVSMIDKNFGNVWTNIPDSLVERAGLEFGRTLRVRIGDQVLDLPFLRTFAEVPPEQPLAFINSRGRLAFARNQASLDDLLHAPRGTKVQVSGVPAERPGRALAGSPMPAAGRVPAEG
jgi:S-adenosylmethionine hydrolase